MLIPALGDLLRRQTLAGELLPELFVVDVVSSVINYSSSLPANQSASATDRTYVTEGHRGFDSKLLLDYRNKTRGAFNILPALKKLKFDSDMVGAVFVGEA